MPALQEHFISKPVLPHGKFGVRWHGFKHRLHLGGIAAQSHLRTQHLRALLGLIEANVPELCDTQRTLSDADTALGLIKLQRLQATVTLYKALGGGWLEDPAATPVVPAPNAPVKAKGSVVQAVPIAPELAPLPPGSGAVAYPVAPR